MNGDKFAIAHALGVPDGTFEVRGVVVYFVDRVAVEDYACGVHRLLSRGFSVTPP
jgi:hypothetical protein